MTQQTIFYGFEPCYVAHFCHDGTMGCDFVCNRVSKNMEEAWAWAQGEARRRNAVYGKGCQVVSICVQYVTAVLSGGVEGA